MPRSQVPALSLILVYMALEPVCTSQGNRLARAVCCSETCAVNNLLRSANDHGGCNGASARIWRGVEREDSSIVLAPEPVVSPTHLLPTVGLLHDWEGTRGLQRKGTCNWIAHLQGMGARNPT